MDSTRKEKVAGLPSVSIIIPAYNAAAYVERTLLSAAAQTYEPLEILLVNDGSTDETLEICNRLAREVPNLRVITIPNGGVANARNTGIRSSQADLVAFLDADDLWHPTKIEKQVANLLEHRDNPRFAGNYVYSRLIDSRDQVTGTGPLHGASGDFFLHNLVFGNVGNGSCLLVRRDVALQVGGFEPAYAAAGIGGCEDRDFELRVLSNHELGLVPEFLTGYRKARGNMSSNRRAMSLGHRAVIKTFLDDPRVTPEVRRLALCQSASYGLPNLIRASEFRESLKTLFEIDIRDQPILFLSSTLIVISIVKRRTLQIRYRLRRPQASPSAMARKFSNYSPTEALIPPALRKRTRAYRRFERLMPSLGQLTK